MKKTRLLALTSLCSILAGMPANAQEIKDSGAKKIGGVETQVNKESSNGKNKKDPEFIKYVKYVLGFLVAEGAHEGLSYFKGEPGRFYEIPARFSLTGYFRKQEELKLAKEKESEYETHKCKMNELLVTQRKLEGYEELKPIFKKIKKSNPEILSKYEIYDQKFINYCIDGYEIGISSTIMLWGSDLKKLKDALVKESGVTEKEFKQISSHIDFYICYVKPDKSGKSVSLMLTFSPKFCDHCLRCLKRVEGSEEVSKFEKDFTLLSERIVLPLVHAEV